MLRLISAAALRLEGCTHGILGIIRMVRTYVNGIRSTIALTVMIYAVFNRAINALDMLFTLFVHHNKRPFVTIYNTI